DYFIPKVKLQEAFAGKPTMLFPQRVYRVYYYKTRQEYNKALIRKQPQIEMTLGIYFDRDRKSHFFAGEDQHASTLYHEVTHQLFQETIRTVRNAGALYNFWLIEGVAIYMESLER